MLTITSGDRQVPGLMGFKVVCTIHKAKVGASVKHVEVYTAIVAEDVAQNLLKVLER